MGLTVGIRFEGSFVIGLGGVLALSLFYRDTLSTADKNMHQVTIYHKHMPVYDLYQLHHYVTNNLDAQYAPSLKTP